jgi:hypothetical protein
MRQVNKKGCLIKRCTRCKIELTESSWHKDDKKDKLYICVNCARTYDKEYGRQHTIQTWRNGKLTYLKGNKRPYPKDNKCEICGKLHKKLDYHHWNDADISKGIWANSRCHQMMELIDKGLHRKYFQLRKMIGE